MSGLTLVERIVREGSRRDWPGERCPGISRLVLPGNSQWYECGTGRQHHGLVKFSPVEVVAVIIYMCVRYDSHLMILLCTIMRYIMSISGTICA